MCEHEPLRHPAGDYPGYYFTSTTVKVVAIGENGQDHTIDNFKVCKKCGSLSSEAVRLGLWKERDPS